MTGFQLHQEEIEESALICFLIKLKFNIDNYNNGYKSIFNDDIFQNKLSNHWFL